MIADLQGLKRGDSHLGYRAHIGIGLAPDNDLRIYGFLVLFLAGQRAVYRPLHKAERGTSAALCVPSASDSQVRFYWNGLLGAAGQPPANLIIVPV